MIKTIIQIIQEKTGLNCYPLLTDAIGECIVYTYEPVSDNGIVKEDRLTIRIITQTIPRAVEIDYAIRNNLLTIGDSSKIDGLLNCEISGGGSLKDEDTQMNHTIKYYYLTYKSEVTL